MPGPALQPTAAAAGIFNGYAVSPQRHDECFAEDGTVRPAWKEFLAYLGASPAAALQSASDAGRRAILDHEVNINVYAGAHTGAQPWPLDVVPLLLDAGSWQALSDGLRQRARLYDALLRDVYGPQKLLAEGRLPPSLVMANPHFLRACTRRERAPGPFLHTYAADVARAPDGSWWVLDDRLDAPSGLGYTLQNRIIVRQVLPEPFRHTPVVRLHKFFRDYRQSLRQLARQRDDARVAVLTPGPANETYFEQSYLARYLGYPLVEGEDLTTRDRQVFLRTVGGLKRVDVLLRRLDSEFCDPVELNHDSLLGVPGLVNASLAGNVALANRLGSRVLENNALLAFLPPLCRHVLGEALAIPSAATWWAGQRKALDYVLANLHGLVIKPVYRGAPGTPKVYGADLSAAERAALAARIQASPADFCGQERIRLGTTPAWNGSALTPVPYVLRVFLTWVDGDYQILPGGLTRYHADGEDSLVTLRQGSVSKDTWVLAAGAADKGAINPLVPAAAPIHARSGADTPSRLADHLYWLGRYIERTSQLARVMQRLSPLLSDEIAVLDPDVASDAVRLAIRLQDAVPPADVGLDVLADRARAIAASPGHAGSLSSNLAQLSRILEIAKIHLPPDAWQLARQVRAIPEAGPLVDRLPVLLTHLASLDGIVAESLPHDTAWRFLDLGRRIERSLQILYAVQGFLTPAEALAPTEFRLQTLLHFTSGLFNYRTSFQGQFQTSSVLASLLGSAESPRSLRYQADRIEEHLRALPDELAPRAVDALRHDAFKLVSLVRLASPDDLAAAPESIGGHARDLIQHLAGLSDRLSTVYFAHTGGGE